MPVTQAHNPYVQPSFLAEDANLTLPLPAALHAKL